MLSENCVGGIINRNRGEDKIAESSMKFIGHLCHTYVMYHSKTDYVENVLCVFVFAFMASAKVDVSLLKCHYFYFSC